jgi:hypothetical protein
MSGEEQREDPELPGRGFGVSMLVGADGLGGDSEDLGEPFAGLAQRGPDRRDGVR